MRTNCEGCAGCCLDWRALAPDAPDPERRGPRPPLDDVHNLAPLLRDEVREFVAAGLGDALTPRLFAADEGDDCVGIDGRAVAAIGDRPVFFVGLRKPRKPVAPFDSPARWLPTCAFLDPGTLQCRIHGDERYPETCSTYPGQHLALGVDPACRRVEAAFGGERLLDDEPPADSGLRLGSGAVGAKLFVHPDPDRLDGVVERAVGGDLTDADRAEFVGVAAASSPGTLAVDDERAAAVHERVLETESWVGGAIAEWESRAGAVGSDAGGTGADETGAGRTDAIGSDAGGTAADRGTGLGEAIEEARGAPPTPGWE